jgi:hypothetical protein
MAVYDARQPLSLGTGMPDVNKKTLSERDICTKLITPALTAGGDVASSHRGQQSKRRWSNPDQAGGRSPTRIGFTQSVVSQTMSFNDPQRQTNADRCGVEELLRWCDRLEAQLRQTRTLGAHLLNSTLHHLLAA